VLLSMTGYGEARHQGDQLNLAVELRALNNRYLKISVRAPEPFNLLESEIEKSLRQVVRRGTIQVQIYARRQSQASDFRLNPVALRTYYEQVRAAQRDLSISAEVPLASLLPLPGVVLEPELAGMDTESEWRVLEPVLQQAVAKLQAMRAEEGKAMERELLQLCDHIGAELRQIKTRAPQVVVDFHAKLLERVRDLLAELDVKLDRSDLIKEVAVFAERSDITEEVVRLGSHLDQFHEITKEPESPGRKLDFLTQEMFREANTIGSKANDVAIAKRVVEIKGAIEKIRELIQNVE
jgi:uncharacterized protein (TIGR00255 family)